MPKTVQPLLLPTAHTTITITLAEIVGIAGFLLSLCLAIHQWKASRITVEISNMTVISSKAQKIGPYLEFTVANKSSLPLSIYSVDLELGECLYTARTRSFSYFNSRFERREDKGPGFIVERPGLALFYARFKPVHLAAYQSTQVYVELDPPPQQSETPHLLSLDNEPIYRPSQAVLHLFTSRHHLEIETSYTHIDGDTEIDNWLSDRKRYLESAYISS